MKDPAGRTEKVLDRQLRAAREALARERDEIARLERSIAARDAVIADFKGSTSWRLTAPVRGLRRMLGGSNPLEVEGETGSGESKGSKTLREGYATPTTVAPAALFGARVLIVAELGLAQCAKYRVWQKQRAFALLGIDCTVVEWSKHEAVRSALQTCSIAIFYRTPGHPEVLASIAEARRLKVPTLWEVDDLIFDEAAYRANRNLETLDAETRASVLGGVPLYRQALLACDYGLASTEALAEAMQAAGVAETFVVENGLDEETVALAAEIVGRRTPRADGRVMVLYGSGSRAHDADFDQAGEGLRRAMAANPQLHLRIVGALQLSDAFTPFADRIDRIPPVDYASYLRLLGEADISLAPLEATAFNEAKSNIKFLEAAVLALPSVCSPRSAFSGAITDGTDGFLAETPDQWETALTALAADSNLRARVGAAAAATAHRLYDPEALAQAQVAPIVARLAPPLPREALRVLAVNIHFAPESFGGATIVAENLTDRLNKRPDTEVVVFTAWPEGLVPGYALNRWEAKGAPVIGVRLPDHVSREQNHRNPRMGELFAGLLEAIRPDVVHLHSIQGLSASLAEACREAGVPYVVTLHDSWWICERQFQVRKDGAYCFQEKIDWSVCATCVKDLGFSIRRYERLGEILRGAAMLLTPSAFHRHLHVANGVDPSLIRVNKNGVAPAADRPRRPLDPSRVRFGFVGGIGPIKGLELIRRAFEALPQSNYELILVDNTLNIGVSQMDVEHWRAAGKITVVPAYGQDTMDDFFGGLDVLLFPSQWKESFGLTVREAGLRDVWVIATDAGGAAEDIVPGENGTIIPIGPDETPLREAIADILDHPERLAGWRNPHKDRITTFDAQAEELAGLLRQAAGQAPEERSAATRASSPRTRARTLSQSPSAG